MGAGLQTNIFLSFPHRNLIAITFVIAPLPNALFSHCNANDFLGSYESTGTVDLGHFLTSLIVVTGFALPMILAYSEVSNTSACVMSIMGGGLVYTTILA
ncbi:vacuolar protein sorting 55 [Lentinula edodes]|nr:vacuolar protein sorting 55 [Lentinula edodes]